MDGDVISFATRAGGRYRLLPHGRRLPAAELVAAAPQREVPKYSVELPDGTVANGALGIERD